MSLPPNLRCPKCGQDSKPEPPAEIISVPVSNVEKSFNFVVRRHKAVCKNGHHFIVDQERIGHHSTLMESELKAQFPKKNWQRMRPLMTAQDYRTFKKSVEGKRVASQDEIAEWKKVQDSLK